LNDEEDAAETTVSTISMHLSQHSLPNMAASSINPLMPTLKLHSNRLLHSNTVIGTLAVDGWAVTFGTARRGLGGLEPHPVPSSLYQM